MAGGLPLIAGEECPSGHPATETRDAVRELLVSELTTHWYPAAIDREHGGFHENFARDWSPRPDSSKSLVYQSRMTWTAAAYAQFDRARSDEFWGMPAMV